MGTKKATVLVVCSVLSGGHCAESPNSSLLTRASGLLLALALVWNTPEAFFGLELTRIEIGAK